jgi:hypothetical protein
MISANMREWLLSDTPDSRMQARMGRFYLGWLAFARNPLGLLGLAVLAPLRLGLQSYRQGRTADRRQQVPLPGQGGAFPRSQIGSVQDLSMSRFRSQPTAGG